MANEILLGMRRSALSALRPPPRLSLSSWIEQHINLPEGVSSLPGQVRLWPFQREIADAIGDPTIERVTLVKPVRVGFTTLLTGALAGYVSNDPAPILALLPTEADCRDYIVSDIEPIFAASPILTGILDQGGDDTADRNTLLSRRFPGGSLKVVAAKAPRNLRRHNVRVLLIDEADGMEVTAEGSPILLAEKRTLSFPDRKIVVGSTPVFATTSHVLRSYGNSDQRVFELPCPHCGTFKEIEWSDIKWPDGAPEKAAYWCAGCGAEVEERHKAEMVENGRWRATAPHVEGHAGFRLNALVSLLANASWGRLAKEFLEAKADPHNLQVFVNTILAQGWNDTWQDIDDASLAGRREDFGFDMVPREVLAVTAGVDVQRDRVELTFVGWTEAGEAFVLGHQVLWGDPHGGDIWIELDGLLSARWPHALGGNICLDAAVVDSGDGNTMERVYAFTFPRWRRKILAGKGVAGSRPWIESTKQKGQTGKLWLIGVDGIKTYLMARLLNPALVRFSRDLPAFWFEQLVSERAVVRYTKGQPVRRFERIPGRAAEALDCTVYAFAARNILTINWPERVDQIKRGGEPVEKPAPAVMRSKWMGG